MNRAHLPKSSEVFNGREYDFEMPMSSEAQVYNTKDKAPFGMTGHI